jgi:Flp pilus assembly protein TadD
MTRWFVPAAVAIAALTACSSSTPEPLSFKEQMRFGVDAGRRGYWQEALFRFERARAQEPANAELLNNVAVTQEALGRFDDALATYKEALKAEPKNQNIRRNYARFAEFYSSYARGVRPKAETYETR